MRHGEGRAPAPLARGVRPREPEHATTGSSRRIESPPRSGRTPVSRGRTGRGRSPGTRPRPRRPASRPGARRLLRRDRRELPRYSGRGMGTTLVSSLLRGTFRALVAGNHDGIVMTSRQQSKTSPGIAEIFAENLAFLAKKQAETWKLSHLNE